MSQPFEWTKENYQKALELSKTKMTMTEIGKVLGTTKNAVLGKLHREKKKNGYKNKQTRGPSHNYYFKTIGKNTCMLCSKEFDIQSRFDRFCMSCKKTDFYRSG